MRLNIFPLLFNRHLLIPLKCQGEVRCQTYNIEEQGHSCIRSFNKHFWSTRYVLGTEETHVSGQGE